MSIHHAPIVGMVFRPPANDVIMLLPVGAKLQLVREPDNPHDPDAIKVLLLDFDENGPYAELFEHLGEMVEADTYGHLKWNLENLTNPLHLGYIANSPKTGGKFASELCAFVMPGEGKEATLVYSASGKPQAEFEIPLFADPEEFVSDPDDIGSQ
jgi:hypothetical protein